MTEVVTNTKEILLAGEIEQVSCGPALPLVCAFFIIQWLGRIEDFREGGSRYGQPKVVPCRRSRGILPQKIFKIGVLGNRPSQCVKVSHCVKGIRPDSPPLDPLPEWNSDFSNIRAFKPPDNSSQISYFSSFSRAPDFSKYLIFQINFRFPWVFEKSVGHRAKRGSWRGSNPDPTRTSNRKNTRNASNKECN